MLLNGDMRIIIKSHAYSNQFCCNNCIKLRNVSTYNNSAADEAVSSIFDAAASSIDCVFD